MMRPLLVIATVLFMTACAGPRAPTLKSLYDQPVKVVKGDISDVDIGDAIDGYRNFLSTTPDDNPLYAQAAIRLADLEMQSGTRRNTHPRGVKSRPGTTMMANNENFVRAIRMYEELLRNHRDDARNDWILYQLARAYELSGRPEQSLRALERLAREYPRSDFALEAQFRRGEMLFQLKKYREAAAAYQAVGAAGMGTPYFDKALYKQGWSYLNMERYEDALLAFFQLFEGLHLDEPVPAGDTNTRITAEQTRKDIYHAMDLSFSYLGGITAVGRFFDRHGERDYEYLIYRSMGDYYLDHERISDAAEAYRAFYQRHPLHPRAADLYLLMITAYEKGKFATRVIEAKEDFVTRFGPHSAFWRKQSEQEHDTLRRSLQPIIAGLANYYHGLAQKKKQLQDFAGAIRWYRAYVEFFSGAPDAPRMNYLLAEAYFEQGQYQEAAAEYEKVAYAYSANDNDAEAGYAAITAYEKLLAASDAKQKEQWQRHWLNAAARFVATYPDDRRGVAVLTTMAERLLQLGDYTRALATAQRVLRKGGAVAPGQRITAAAVAGHAAFELQDYLVAEAHYQEALQLQPKDKALYAHVQDRLAAAVYKQAEARQTDGDARGAAERFTAAAVMARDTSVRATAEYDAATNWMAAGDWRAAIRILESFRQDFPNHELAGGVTQKLAVAYEKNGEILPAAREYRRIATEYTDAKICREAAWRAAQLFERGEAIDDAVAAFKSYVYAYPQPFEQAMEARNRLAALYRTSGDSGKRQFWLNDMIKANGKAGKRGTQRTRYLAASAALALADVSYQAFRELRLEMPLKESFKVKADLMRTALDAYGKAADYGIAEITTAATYGMGEIYHETAAALISSQRPKGLSAQEQEQYALMVEEQAFPFEEKAIAIHATNASRAKDGFYDEWVRKSFNALGKLFPVRYAKVEHGDTVFETIY